MDDLPELPFEQILNYLSLEDRLKSRAVARRWYWKINSSKVNSLCYSQRPSGFIYGKSQLVSGAFASNFISSPRLESMSRFVNTFSESILSNLKQLHLCNLRPYPKTIPAFAQTLSSFDQLEELDIIRFNCQSSRSLSAIEFELNLPMLRSVHLENFNESKLTLDAPRLQKIKLLDCWKLRLDLVHGESVERLLSDRLSPQQIAVQNLKNLKYLYVGRFSSIDPTLLSGLDQLKEVHLFEGYDAWNIFEQMQQYGRADLNVYLSGYHLNDRDDLQRSSLDTIKEAFVYLCENPSRLADEIPFLNFLDYSAIESVDPELAIDVMNRFTRLAKIFVREPVQDIERFLDVLKTFSGHIVEFGFSGAQPLELFDRLPEHFTVQRLTIEDASSGFEFLFKLKHLIGFAVHCSLDAELIRKLFEALEFLSYIQFAHDNKSAAIRIAENSEWTRPKRFQVAFGFEFFSWLGAEWTDVPDLEAAIQFITEPAPQESGQLQSP